MEDSASVVSELAAGLALEMRVHEVRSHEDLCRRAVEMLSRYYPDEAPTPDANGNVTVGFFEVMLGALMYEASRRHAESVV